jgi:predicted N-acetyltransferase YhbS
LSQAGQPLTVRALHAGDDLDAELDLQHRAFGPISTRDAWLDELAAYVADTRLYGVWDGQDQVGSALYHDMRQWWHGRPLPMAGVGGVKIAPEARGRGAGRALMTGLLGAMAERGYLLSVLYPATAYFYRSLGWELAGGQYRAEIPGRSLGSLRPADPLLTGPAGSPPAVRRAGPGDADRVIATLGAIYAAARDCGPCTEDPASVRRWLAEPGIFAYLAEDGFLAYGWRGSAHEIRVQVLQAASARTTRALWGVVGSNATVTEIVRAYVGPADPITWLTQDDDVGMDRHHSWMLRVLDARAAIAARGFPATAQTRVALELSDPDLPANAGAHILTVAAGQGSLVRGDTNPTPRSPSAAPVSLGPRGFAAMFAGVPMATLRRAGLASGGDPDADTGLDCAFAAQPYLLDYF